jgi:anaerobic magnesium-protoporphyrin IX monomethyl ester cyclase
MVSMNVLFIYTNINGAHEETYAFGLASLVAVAKKSGYSSKVIIARSHTDYEKILAAIETFSPAVVALTSVSSQFSFIKEIASQVKKKNKSIIVVCGGVHPTVMPESILETDAIDAFFIGESEISFEEFLNKVQEQQDFYDTPNLCYNENGIVKSNHLHPLIEDLDSLPYPDKISYPYVDTVSQYGVAPFMFSRGCPYLCSYCCNHTIARIYNLKRNTPRYRSPESSIREIEWTIKKFPFIKIIWCLDDTFGIDKKWREEFCRKYKERIGIKLALHMRVNVINEDFIRLLEETGCYRISFGVESGNEHIRNKVMNRQMTNKEITNAFALAKKYGIETNAFNIIGVPGETEETIWDTIRLNRILTPTDSGINIFYPYRGTELGEYCYKNGLVNEALVKDFSNERRDTVLNFPEDFKKKLIYYHENWSVIIYPWDIKLRLKWFLMKNPCLWEFLRKLKKRIYISLGKV